MRLRGTFTALITPFSRTDESIDFTSFEKILQHQIQGGVEGLVPCGTTGESPTLSHAEHAKVISWVIEKAKALNPNIIVMAGTGSNSTKEAVELSRNAVSDGADYLLSVNPYYNKPTQEGLYRHFSTIADNARAPVILYNIPGRTGVQLSIDTIKRLAAHGNIAGIKEATGDLNFMTQVILETPEEFSVLSGDDNLLLPLLSVGGDGVVSVVSNLFPKETSDITRFFHQGKTADAEKLFRRIFPLCKAMFVETNPIPVKYSASVLGLCENVLRLPMTPLSQANVSFVESALEQFRKSQ